ncbi:hypothetical protein GPY51_03635 [Photorhabdus laumondii subsp. laumondii]|uniref:Uncharacterized protein n=1 Tax=Photorhabdus laumondii subsp. laumondii TaxID=141679 RepID=A0A6L9JMM2_PHOLM|nr:hypothetical protein [Photorhabdus sp. S15-56]NDL37901.1 hypothetical protein [Photorhabdus laumondii subsp. laumondii]
MAEVTETAKPAAQNDVGSLQSAGENGYRPPELCILILCSAFTPNTRGRSRMR